MHGKRNKVDASLSVEQTEESKTTNDPDGGNQSTVANKKVKITKALSEVKKKRSPEAHKRRRAMAKQKRKSKKGISKPKS